MGADQRGVPESPTLAALSRVQRKEPGEHVNERTSNMRELAAELATRRWARISAADQAARSYHDTHDVALSALRGTTGRDGALLGLPPIVDHLFDLSPLPTFPHCRHWLVRARPEAAPPDRARAAWLLAGALLRGRGRDVRHEGAHRAASAQGWPRWRR
jgi:hypothetical protein